LLWKKNISSLRRIGRQRIPADRNQRIAKFDLCVENKACAFLAAKAHRDMLCRHAESKKHPDPRFENNPEIVMCEI
jgi:hypothetical protein